MNGWSWCKHMRCVHVHCGHTLHLRRVTWDGLHAHTFLPRGVGSGVMCHTNYLSCNRWMHTHMHTPTLTVPCPSKVGRVLTCVTRLADQGGIWARTSWGGGWDTQRAVWHCYRINTHSLPNVFKSGNEVSSLFFTEHRGFSQLCGCYIKKKKQINLILIWKGFCSFRSWLGTKQVLAVVGMVGLQEEGHTWVDIAGSKLPGVAHLLQTV